MNGYRFFFICPAFLILLLLGGCRQERLPGMPDLYPLKITVIQDGQPLADAHLFLQNTDPSVNWPGAGQTDAKGVFRANTMGKYDGIAAGKYRVSVQKNVLPDWSPPDEGDPNYRKLKKEYDDNCFSFVDQSKFSLAKTQLEIIVEKKTNNLTLDVSPAVKQPIVLR